MRFLLLLTALLVLIQSAAADELSCSGSATATKKINGEVVQFGEIQIEGTIGVNLVNQDSVIFKDGKSTQKLPAKIARNGDILINVKDSRFQVKAVISDVNQKSKILIVLTKGNVELSRFLKSATCS
ncbi:MAG: hypothetical protein HWE12_05760 [Oceanospirillaceae bacterium]|nr:hypothetical protein [Oceanospirillaceae bacterium]